MPHGTDRVGLLVYNSIEGGKNQGIHSIQERAAEYQALKILLVFTAKIVTKVIHAEV